MDRTEKDLDVLGLFKFVGLETGSANVAAWCGVYLSSDVSRWIAELYHGFLELGGGGTVLRYDMQFMNSSVVQRFLSSAPPSGQWPALEINTPPISHVPH